MNEPDFRNYLDCIFDYYYNSSENKFDTIFNKTKEKNIFISCFYLSDEDKIKLIDKQQEYILSLEEKDYNTINTFISDWFSYAHYLDFKLKKEELFKKLSELDVDLDTPICNTKKFNNFKKEYEKYKENYYIKNYISKMQTSDIKQIIKNIKELNNNYCFLSDESKKLLIKAFDDNKFYLKSLDGNISFEDWNLAHTICKFISRSLPEIKDNLKEYLILLREQHKKDKSCDYRIKSLIEQYNL